MGWCVCMCMCMDGVGLCINGRRSEEARKKRHCRAMTVREKEEEQQDIIPKDNCNCVRI